MKRTHLFDSQKVKQRAAEVRGNWTPSERNTRRGLPPDAAPWIARLFTGAIADQSRPVGVALEGWSNTQTA